MSSKKSNTTSTHQLTPRTLDIDNFKTPIRDVNLASLALLYSLPRGRPIWGVATLDNDQYVVRAGSNEIEVYHYTVLRQRIVVPGLSNARDMVACQTNNCFYITDIGRRPGRTYAIHRVSLDGDVTTWPMDDKPWGVSVTPVCTVLVTCVDMDLLVEFDTHGNMLREIQLPPEIVHPLHAELLPVSGELLVGHGDGPDSVHRVSALTIADDGRTSVIRSTSGMNRKSESDGVSDRVMDVPGHLALDATGRVLLVADVNNNRILLTSPRLDNCNVLLELDEGREYPVRMSTDPARGRLYVAYNGDILDGQWTSGRVLVFFFVFGENCV